MLTELELPFRFDIDRMRADLGLVGSAEWSAHYNTGDYEGEWRGAALRSATGSASELAAVAPAFQDTELLGRCGYFREVLSAFRCPLKSVRLLSLTAGSFIREHSDNALDYEDGEIRIHVPVRTSPEVEFYLSGERLALEEGGAYYVNVNLPHCVSNRGTADRIHLVIDAGVNDWVREVFGRSSPIPRCAPPSRGVVAFRDLSLTDRELREELRCIADTYEFETAAARIGRERGFDFHEGDVRTLLKGVARPGPAGGLARAVWFRGGRPWVEWIEVGQRPLTKPFFEESVRECLRNPYARFSRRASPLEEPVCSGRAPSGFIFHMSRCGSTLAGRMLSAAGYRVIPEAPSIDRIVREGGGNVRWLRAIVEALGGDDPYFVKLDAWHIHRLPLFREAFPDTPWVFLFRDPGEVLVSHSRNPGLHTVPGAIDPAAVEMTLDEVTALPPEEWRAAVLAKICHSALRFRDDPGGLLLDYRELPEALWGKAARRFGVEFSADQIERMRAVAGFDAKRPGTVFQPSVDRERTTPELDALYQKLINQRAR